MIKPKTLLLVLLALPLVSYGLVYAYAWFSVKSVLDDLAAQLGPVADFGRGAISVGPTGSVAVRDLIFSPRQTGGAIRVERVELKTPGLEFILTGSSSLRAGKVPRRLGLAMTGIRVDRDSPIWGAIPKRNAVDRRRPANGLACDISSIAWMQGAAASLMPDRFVADLESLFEMGTAPGTATLHLALRDHGLFQVKADLRIGHVGVWITEAAASAALESAVLTVSLDADYAGEAQRLCAEGSRLPVERFLPTLLAQDERAYLRDIGMVPGPGIRQLLQGYLSGLPVEVRIAPLAGFDLSTVTHYRREDVPRLLNMQAALDGTPVTDLSLTTESGEVSGSGRPDASSAGTAAQTPGLPPGEIGFADLARCLGCTVQITVRDGRERRGLVDRVENGIVHLAQQRQEGWVTWQIPRG